MTMEMMTVTTTVMITATIAVTRWCELRKP
jgi:hypothetical protein